MGLTEEREIQKFLDGNGTPSESKKKNEAQDEVQIVKGKVKKAGWGEDFENPRLEREGK